MSLMTFDSESKFQVYLLWVKVCLAYGHNRFPQGAFSAIVKIPKGSFPALVWTPDQTVAGSRLSNNNK